MESTDLTCAKCGATWKLIKASAEGAACPYCNASIGAAPAEPAASKPIEPLASVTPPTTEQAPTTPPEAAAAAAPLASTAPVTEDPSIPATVRAFDVPDTDDPGLVDDYDDRLDPRRRRGMNPVAKTILILILLIFLAPVALFLILFVVCVVMMAARSASP